MEPLIASAVVGCGRMGAFTAEIIRRHAPACWFPLSHAEAIRQHSRLDLRALCDVDADTLSRAAATHGVKATYTDARRMLDDIRPRLLGIATRTVSRAQLMIDAVDRGARALHVEKPLCNSVLELQALSALMAPTDVFVTYGTIRRFFAVYRKARELAESGRYGALREVRVNLGSGTLYWTHPHAIDLILFIAGRRTVAGVQARLAEVVAARSPVDIESDPRVITASVHFDDGVTGHITQALGSDLVLSCTDAEIAVRADGGRLEIYAVRTGSIYPSTELYEGEVSTDGPQGTLAPVSQLVACLYGDSQAVAQNDILKRDILMGQRIAFAMLQSHLEGSRIVSPDAIDPAAFIHARTGGRHA